MFDSTESNYCSEHYKTPRKIKRVDGLLTLSSLNKKKTLSLKNVQKDRLLIIDMNFDYGRIRRDSFSKFMINVFQYILYDKNAIPIPFNYFDKLHIWDQNGKKKILLDTFTKLKFVFDFFLNLLMERKILINCVALCLGDSLRFAKEIFIINLEKLNLNNEFDESTNLPFLTLRYMIDSFYKRLLNEIPEEIFEQKSKQVNVNAKNILFSIKTPSKCIDDLKTFMEIYSQDNQLIFKDTNFSINTSNFTCRLGSVMSKITHFKFDHKIQRTLTNLDNFDIYLDVEDDVEEVIEENFIITNSDNVIESSNENSKQENYDVKDNENEINEDSSIFFEESNSFWIQIGPPIRCVSKF